VLTRLHRANIIADVFGGAKPIHQALARFKADGRGVLILLRDIADGTLDKRHSLRGSRRRLDTGS
jgi:3,4-dihydroxy 2-butanone 4-phosphate synthase/GTP cyclohydrolase II